MRLYRSISPRSCATAELAFDSAAFRFVPYIAPMSEIVPAVIEDLRVRLDSLKDAVVEAMEALGSDGDVIDLDRFRAAQAKADHLIREMLAIQDR